MGNWGEKTIFIRAIGYNLQLHLSLAGAHLVVILFDIDLKSFVFGAFVVAMCLCLQSNPQRVVITPRKTLPRD